MNHSDSTQQRTRIKFCGITRAEDARQAITLGVDALGFVLVPQSPRAIVAAEAAKIRASLPPFVHAVALFRNVGAASVRAVLKILQPDLIQFHGDEDAAFCEQFGLPYLKAVSMAKPQDLSLLAARYQPAKALLLDSHSPEGMGGTGHVFDWTKVRAVKKPLILAGGLNAENVGAGIQALRPYAVDVSSGIESAPGIKNFEKMRAFVQAVRLADHTLTK
jgi:phosphoribosylanthranilate isomerase